MNRRVKVAALLLVLVAGPTVYASRPQLPKGVVLFDSRQAVWVPGGGPGSVRAAIYGDPGAEGPYLHIIKVPPGRISRAHSYSDDRTYRVMTGTWYVGFGDRYDESKLTALTAGSYYALPGGVSVFNATRGEGAVIEIGGTGPTKHIESE